MGAIDPQSPLWCCNGDCGRTGWINVNWLPGFLCYVCDRKEEGDRNALNGLCARLSRSRRMPFECHLDLHGCLALRSMEFLCGGGWEDQCPCQRCEPGWLESRWVCPTDYHRRWYMQIQDRRLAGRGYTLHRIQSLDLDWNAMVIQQHHELCAD